VAELRRQPREEILAELEVAEAMRAMFLEAGSDYLDPDWSPPDDGLRRLSREGFDAELRKFDAEVAELKRQLAAADVPAAFRRPRRP
jgi:hypothetical protein